MPEGLTEEEQKQYAGLDEEEREEFRKQMKEELEKRAKEKPAVAPAGPAVPEAPAPPARGPGRPATPGGELAPPDLRSILVGLASTDVETRAEAAESARRYPDKDVAAKHVMRVLKDKDAEVRQLAASTLGALGQAAALPALLDVIQTDRNDGVRATAIRAIKEIGGPDAVATLRGIVRDGNEPGDRASALSILTDLGIVGDVRDLIKGATRELSPEIRLQAAVAVRTFLLKDYEAFILPLLDDASDGVIVEALRACSAIKARGAVGKAVALLGDAEHEEIVTDAAAVSLKAITGEDLGYADTLLETQRLVAIDAWKQWWKKNGEAWDKGTYAPGKK